MMLEYHTSAVNFALGNKVAVMGIIYPESSYNICTDDIADSTNQVGKAVRVIFKDNGSLPLLYRPPLISLLLGITYKCFGVNLLYGYILNLLFISLTAALMPVILFKLWKNKGVIAGLIAALIFLKLRAPMAEKIGPEPLISLLLTLMLLATISIQNAGKFSRYLLLGMLFGIGILTKGNSFFLAPLYALFILITGWRQPVLTVKKIGGIMMGGFIIMLPWMIWANYLRLTTVTEREQWKKSVQAYSPDIIAKNKAFKLGTASLAELIELLTKVMYPVYADANNLVIITNQMNLSGKTTWWINNEYCVDGQVHPEVELVQNTYYNNKHPEISDWHKILYFYKDNPSYFLPIIKGKINGCSRNGFWFSWLACILWGFCVLQARIYQSHGKRQQFFVAILLIVATLFAGFTALHPSDAYVPYYIALLLAGSLLYKASYQTRLPIMLPIGILNSFLICIIFVGEPRYLEQLDCIAIPCCVYFTLLMPAEFISAFNKPNSNQISH